MICHLEQVTRFCFMQASSSSTMNKVFGGLSVIICVVLALGQSVGANAPFIFSSPPLARASPQLTVMQQLTYCNHPSGTILSIRGGSDDDDDEEEELDAEEDEEETDGDSDAGDAVEPSSPSALGSIFRFSKQSVVLAVKLTFRSLKATGRALQAAFQGPTTEDDDDAEETGLVTRMFRLAQRMWTAAFNPQSVSDNGKTGQSTKGLGKSSDYASFLSKAYKVNPTRDEVDDISPVLGGTISDALKLARSQARLLVVLIPSAKPGKNDRVDVKAIEGFLSAEVAAVAERKARKNGESGSFLLWSAKAGSPEAVVALKRLKATLTNAKGQKRPILLVAYPAQVVDASGIPRTVPKLLAQHHCSPPPSAELMATWLNALRKRHAKQFAAMQNDLKELQIHLERKEGYKESVRSDLDRKEREKREEAERIAKEKAEKEREEMIRQRRQDLKESLPEEPGNDDAGAKTIALRLADGRSAQRRFAGSCELSTLFDWVDATFEMERETVVLTLMNGKKSFTYDACTGTLQDAGLGRMTGFRVTTKATEQIKPESA